MQVCRFSFGDSQAGKGFTERTAGDWRRVRLRCYVSPAVVGKPKPGLGGDYGNGAPEPTPKRMAPKRSDGRDAQIHSAEPVGFHELLITL